MSALLSRSVLVPFISRPSFIHSAKISSLHRSSSWLLSAKAFSSATNAAEIKHPFQKEHLEKLKTDSNLSHGLPAGSDALGEQGSGESLSISRQLQNSKSQKQAEEQRENELNAEKDLSVVQMGGVRLPGRAVYLDFQATTPIDPRVLDAMLPYMTDLFGNPHSRTHHYGWESEKAVETAREQVARLIGADPKEIVFTSGATESNNEAIKGVGLFYSTHKKHVITTVTEHKCVLDSFLFLRERHGFNVTFLPVQPDGLINLEELEKAIRPDTSLVSVMAVNNEIGVIQPLKEIGEICRRKGVFFHTDAAQAVGKIPIDVNECKIDCLSISGHKIYGPKGVGALYVRRRPRVRLQALMSGGGQERGLRSGTLPTALCVGLGKAAEIAREERELDFAEVKRLSDKLYNGITSRIDQVILNGHPEKRYVGNLNLSFSYVEGESLLMALREVAVSSGSACTSASLEPSYVLRALGVEADMAHTSIRFGVGRFTTDEEIDYAIELCVKHVKRLRDMSPLWEMVNEGVDLKTIQWTE